MCIAILSLGELLKIEEVFVMIKYMDHQSRAYSTKKTGTDADRHGCGSQCRTVDDELRILLMQGLLPGLRLVLLPGLFPVPLSDFRTILLPGLGMILPPDLRLVLQSDLQHMSKILYSIFL